MCLGSMTPEPGDPGVASPDTGEEIGDMRGGVTPGPSPSSITSSLVTRAGRAIGGWNQAGSTGRGRGVNLSPGSWAS